jgi:outer membrane murein-binding lipoprotein Lpp
MLGGQSIVEGHVVKLEELRGRERELASRLAALRRKSSATRKAIESARRRNSRLATRARRWSGSRRQSEPPAWRSCLTLAIAGPLAALLGSVCGLLAAVFALVPLIALRDAAGVELPGALGEPLAAVAAILWGILGFVRAALLARG